ncbi:MAG TPA: hypothetical protein VIL30_00540, partial [Ramlibacter sp.]
MAVCATVAQLKPGGRRAAVSCVRRSPEDGASERATFGCGFPLRQHGLRERFKRMTQPESQPIL